jgi:L-alanine-DL-glutamate epimerase-like enolase superfamily enzyme
VRIDAIEIYRVSMPLVYPFRTAFSDEDVIESVLARLRSGLAYGWGEANPWGRRSTAPGKRDRAISAAACAAGVTR